MLRPALLAIALLGATAVDAAEVRIFAVGHKIRMADVTTYGAYHDKMAALMDAAFPGRASLVQAGLDDVASHLYPADPLAPPLALVVFAEDVGLPAALIGTRGAGARAATTAAAAISAMVGPYSAQGAYYNTKYPSQPGIRALVLALTDTIYRSFYETFRELAMTHGVYLATCGILAPARRVEEADEPALVALLRDPDEPLRTYAYEAVSPLAYNTTLVFAPDGEILVPDGNGGLLKAPSETGGVLSGSTNKAYLTPIEQPPPGNAQGLSLAFAPARDMEVLDTPVGRLAIVISKDAWMVDVNDRFETKGANVILQPEAFSAWGYATTPWEPDIFKEGGFATLQKQAGFLFNVNASLTGNFFADVTFDGQTAILERKEKASPGPLSADNAWIGQNPDTGFRLMAPWIIPDPGITNPGMSLADRRTALAASGANLLPNSGVPCPGPLDYGSCEDGYREALVYSDVVVPDDAVTAPVDPVRAPPPAFEAALRVSGIEGPPVSQHAPSIAAWNARVYVAWHQADPGGLENVYLAVSRDRGQTFSAPIRVSDNVPGQVAELNPVVAARGNRVVVAWQEFDAGRDDDAGKIRLAVLTGRGRKRFGDVRVDDQDGAGKWLPAIALVNRRDPVVAWIDERDTGGQGQVFEHVYAARGTLGGQEFGPSVRVDAGAAVPLAVRANNKWSVTVTAVEETVYAAWADFRNYNWDIFLARSTDGGQTWGANVRVDDFAGFERINERPSLAAADDGTVHAIWTDLRAREADTNVFYARSVDGGASFPPGVQLDDSKTGFDPDTDTPSNQWHPSLVLSDGTLFAAWQDNRLGNNDVFFTTSTDGGTTFAPNERVDDTGTGGSEQTRPRLAVGGRGPRRMCYAAWEDDRDGTRDIYFSRRPCP
jgi:predicted amidohydrolase